MMSTPCDAVMEDLAALAVAQDARTRAEFFEHIKRNLRDD